MRVTNLIGQRFGRLFVVERHGSNKNGRALWLCQCDCGNEKIVLGHDLLRGSTNSCGCLQRELSSQRLKKYNTFDLSGDYGIGYTSKDEPFYFDLEDYEKIKDYCWYFHPDGYVYANNNDVVPRTLIKLHDLIIGCKYVDHIGGVNTRNDNRKSNLRVQPDGENFHSYNNMNKCIQKNNTSGHVGVSWCKEQSKWEAYISINKSQKYLGLFNDYDDAVRVRKEAEEKYFGEYSYDNSQQQYQSIKYQTLDEGD